MKEYEVVFIAKPSLGEDVYKTIAEQFQAVIEKEKGEILSFSLVGIKELAQIMNKKYSQGHYFACQFKATPKVLEVIQQYFSVTEDIFRHLVVTLESITEPEVVEKKPQEKKVIKEA